MSSRNQNPGTGPATKREVQNPHRSPNANGGSVPQALKSRRGRKSGAESPAAEAAEQKRVYELTELYKKGVRVYETDRARLQFNQWVRANQAQIDPRAQSFCADCGNVAFELCECHTAKVVLPEAEVLEQSRTYTWSFDYWAAFKKMFSYPSFTFGEQNNKNTAGFCNGHITDDNIIKECYNYITANMQTSYQVCGVEKRDLALAHSHRLGHRWLEQSKNRAKLEKDTVYKNRFMFTVQRACDTSERRVLYEYTDPERNFGLAWLPGSGALRYLVGLLGFIVLWLLWQLYGPTLLAYILPKLAALAAHQWVRWLTVVLSTFLAGSEQVLWSALSMLIGLLSAYPLVIVVVLCVLWLRL